jgi:glycosyltransferase involved in cell wall biosynthesis
VAVFLFQKEFSGASGWIAGFYYLRNCLNALATLDRGRAPRVLVFAPEGFREALVFPEAGEKADWLETVAIPERDLGRPAALQAIVDRHPFDLLFPLASLPAVSFGAPAVGWIPDFQHRHHPAFFSPIDLELRDQTHDFIVAFSSRIVCSSQTVKDDLTTFHPLASCKASVVRFRATLPRSLLARDPAPVLAKYGIEGAYAYLPNQFWVHKNHETAFKAWRRLASAGDRPLLVCTGQPLDPRSPQHYDRLRRFLRDHALEDCVKLLGFIPREDQIDLYRCARLVIQPSLFEGWSTSIEEASALGKPLVAADTPIHREQCAQEAAFFPPTDDEALAGLLRRMWPHLPAGRDAQAEARAMEASVDRTQAFGRELATLFREVAATPQKEKDRQVRRLLLSVITGLQRTIDLIESDREDRLQLINQLSERVRAGDALQETLKADLAQQQERIQNLASENRMLERKFVGDVARPSGSISKWFRRLRRL